MPSWHGFREEETEAELEARARSLGLRSGLGDEWLRLGGMKMAIDGGTSSHTAFMHEPFEGETEVRNFNRLDPATLRRHFRTAQELGWDVGIHTTGDRAMDMVVDAFAAVAREVSWPDARHNVIHAYFPSDRALRQMGEHRIGAVIQPTFLYWEGDMIFRDVGERRAANYKPARKYLDHGVVVCANSDIPSTVSMNPFVGLYALGGTTDVPLGTVTMAVVGVHILIGLGEAAITGLTVGSIIAVRPDLVYGARGIASAVELRHAPVTV
jgi:predicted amidohydrolase YtcJ